jgi:hypothetical protein
MVRTRSRFDQLGIGAPASPAGRPLDEQKPIYHAGRRRSPDRLNPVSIRSAAVQTLAEVQAAIKNDVPNIKLATTAYRAARRRVML